MKYTVDALSLSRLGGLLRDRLGERASQYLFPDDFERAVADIGFKGIVFGGDSVPYDVTVIGAVDTPYGASFGGSSGNTRVNTVSFLGIGDEPYSLPDYFCYRNTSMTGIALPPNTIRIGGNAFEYCTSLTSVTGLGNVTGMGQSAFGGCTAVIEELDFPSLGTWTNGAFNGARGIKRILLPKISTLNVNTAFQNCTGLKYLQLGSIGNGITVSTVGTSAFNGVTQTDLVVDCYTSSGLMNTLLSNMRTRGLTGATINMKAASDLTYNGTAYAAGETVIQSVPE